MPFNLEIMLNQKKNNFSQVHLTTILYNLLCALSYVHSANIMHRNIKPANILLDEDCQIKLCGFSKATSINLIDKS